MFWGLNTGPRITCSVLAHGYFSNCSWLSCGYSFLSSYIRIFFRALLNEGIPTPGSIVRHIKLLYNLCNSTTFPIVNVLIAEVVKYKVSMV